MLSRQAFRVAQPLRTQCRRYATEAPKSGGSNGLLYTGIAAVLGGGGYYFYSSRGGDVKEDVKSVANAVAATTGSSSKATFTGGEQGFVSLTLQEVENINHNTKHLRFALPEADQTSGMTTASALLTKFQGPGMEKPVIRPYTPTSDVDQRGHLDLIVKAYPGGPMSEHMHALQPGQTLDFKGPLPKYPWTPNKHDHIALVAGGTGITPMWQLARAIFANPADTTKVTLVFGNVTEDDILLKKELRDLENTYPQRFRAFYVLGDPPKEWAGGKGFITKDLLKTVLPEPNQPNIKIFVCGPPPMYKAISGPKVSPQDQGELDGILKDLGYNKDQVYKF